MGELEGLGKRQLQRASAVLRENVGDRPAPSSAMGFSEYGKQIFTLLSQILALNPANLMRARLSRRQSGRFDETSRPPIMRRKLLWIRFGMREGNKKGRRRCTLRPTGRQIYWDLKMVIPRCYPVPQTLAQTLVRVSRNCCS